MKYRKLSGTEDIIPPRISLWQKLEREVRAYFESFGYQEIRTPIIEEAELFIRSIGEFSDIVQKQFYCFRSAGGKNICLRPEVTASVARAYVENALYQKKGVVKFYYISANFRAERPQAGRRRQFHQIGIELIGSQYPIADAEIIFLLHGLLKKLRVCEFTIELNSLGCEDDKKKFISLLEKNIASKLKGLCQTCQERFGKNTLRILDCKNNSCKNVLKELKISLKQRLCPTCFEHFLELRTYLEALKIDYQLNDFLVRGLDYYTKTVFEITSPRLGAQNAIGAGGRYDNLIEEVGGPPTPATGFAIGIERLLSLLEMKEEEPKPVVFIATQNKNLKIPAFATMLTLREKGILTEGDYQDRSLKSQLRLADSLGVRYVVIFGEEEWSQDQVAIKDLKTGKQFNIAKDDILKAISDINDA